MAEIAITKLISDIFECVEKGHAKMPMPAKGVPIPITNCNDDRTIIAGEIV